MKYLIYIPLILFIIVSCKKKQTIKVRVINPVTGEGYANLDVQIEACKSGAFEDRCKVVYSGATNENGIALIETRLNTSWRHTLYVDLPEDYCYSNGISEPIFDNESDNHEFTFERAPCAFLKLKIENQNCLSQNDEVFYQRHWVSGDETSNGVTQYGCFQYEGDYFRVPMGQYKYTWNVKKTGVNESFEENFYLDEGEYYTLEIFY